MEKGHPHRGLTKLADFDKDRKEQKLPLPDKIELPLVLNLPPQSVHTVKNLDIRTFHTMRIEFKKGFQIR